MNKSYVILMDKVAIEAFLFSADFGEDNYLLASSSSSDSDSECCCSEESSSSAENVPLKRPRVEGFAEVDVPQFSDSEFKNHFRVSRATCQKIIELIHDDFYSDHKGGWEKITPVKAAYILLWYLGNRETFKLISERFKITQSCVYNIVKVGCRNLSSKFNEYIKWPESDQYEEESESIYEICEIYGIIGAIGVSHIKILRPRENQEHYTNVKNYHSIAVQGVVGHNKKFFDLYVGEGSLEPVELLQKSYLVSKAEDGFFGDYFLVGNNSYPNLPWLIIPFDNGGNLTAKQMEFNQHHECAHRLFSNTFGQLKARFQRLNIFENKDIPFIISCIKTVCVIHNICMDYEDDCELFVEDDGIFIYDVEDEVVDNSDGGKRMEVFNLFLETDRTNM
ncbi:hypothetical protein NQ314_011135 [Rhamnusium bicolor]|uniref:DDE Tnp4 domain-containing protein n=1 Tax=Rhamnusium bicolor TaxID=1586634 RepID=A0AAV8XLM3_9CUCU|nr:hypothetical protein NQ314_011135 [Rhamnusium bicolor]